jgi:hypothetical protein
MTKDEALNLALEALEKNRREHYYCEDTWYSCPKHEDGCANEAQGDKCNCGVDKANQEIDRAITAIKQARSAPVQELTLDSYDEHYNTTPPAAQRQWVGLDFSEVDELAREMIKGDKSVNWLAFSIDAKLKEKNT